MTIVNFAFFGYFSSLLVLLYRFWIWILSHSYVLQIFFQFLVWTFILLIFFNGILPPTEVLSFNLVDYINLFVYNLLLRMCLFKGILYSQDHIFLSIIHIDICWGFPLYLHSSSSGASWLLLKLLLIYNILLVSDVQQSDSVI